MSKKRHGQVREASAGLGSGSAHFHNTRPDRKTEYERALLRSDGKILWLGGAKIWENVFWTFEVSKDWIALPYNWQRLEATVLHEMVHWARSEAGLPQDLEEMGDSFEKTAYKNQSCNRGAWTFANALAHSTLSRPAVDRSKLLAFLLTRSPKERSEV